MGRAVLNQKQNRSIGKTISAVRGASAPARSFHPDTYPAPLRRGVQAELVAEMQDWFGDQADGKKMPDSRSIRRRITPVWRALRRENA